MSFQAVTGASTNAPSVSGEAGRGLVWGTGVWRVTWAKAWQARPPWTLVGGSPQLRDGCRGLWGPEAEETSAPDCDGDIPAPHCCLGAKEDFYFPSDVK